MRRLVMGRELRCELDGSRTHDRCAGICYRNGMDIGAEMVRQGLAAALDAVQRRAVRGGRARGGRDQGD